MTRACKKCNCEKIIGPSYVYEEDRLKFICTNCGYWWTAPTAERTQRDFEESRRHKGDIE